MNIGIVLLAAGTSSRMGKSKQLLPIKDEPMLLHSVKIALSAKTQHVIVVLGARNQEHSNIIKHLPVEVVINAHWQSGMGSSIKAGLAHLKKKSPAADAIIIMVCDQPHVSTAYLQKIIQEHITSGRSIVASLYQNSPGVPVLFSKNHFEALSNLEDSWGAKKVILDNPEEQTLLNFPEGAIDLDTMEDYNTFLKNNKSYTPGTR